MKPVILIPARSGSKRVKDKNIKLLGGKPLFAWSILTGKELGIDTYVSTDSLEYIDIAREYGVSTVYRPAEFSGDDATDADVIRHFVSQVEADLVVYLRPTTPLRSSGVVWGAVKLMSYPGAYDSLRSVHEMSESAYKCFRIKAGLLYPLTKTDLTDKPNQAVVKTFHPNGYVDIIRAEFATHDSIWGSGRYAYITSRVPEIDSEDDFEYVEWLVHKKGRVFAYGQT